MGVVNVTPDSFSDGGRYLDARAAIAHGEQLAAEGAAILDVGGESTRPGADPVPRRGGAAARRCRSSRARAGVARVSIDTSKAAVAAAALDAGATTSTTSPPSAATRSWPGWSAERGVDCCLMHMLGTPRTMQDDPRYDDVVSEVKAFLEERLAYAVGEGVAEERVMLDPGIGFGKTRRAQPRADPAARRDRRARAAGRVRRLAQVVPRQADRPRASASGRSRPPPRTCSRSSGARRSSASTTCPRRSMRSPWPLLR